MGGGAKEALCLKDSSSESSDSGQGLLDAYKLGLHKAVTKTHLYSSSGSLTMAENADCSCSS